MAKINKLRLKYDSKCSGSTQFSSSCSTQKICKVVRPKKKGHREPEKKDLDDVRCSVCMESPHNAVLLLCSSYNKGCRSYMCATSNRFSNCLDQYKKFYTKAASLQNSQPPNDPLNNLRSILCAGQHNGNVEVPELLCPLCRGQVKGWTVVKPARKYFNAKKRSCMQDNCLFVGSYKKLRSHVRENHALSCPRAVDPVLEEKWKRLECERERSDVISTILTSTPGARVFGDYVIEPAPSGFYSDYDSDMDEYLDDFHWEPFNLRQRGGNYARNGYHGDYDSVDDAVWMHQATSYSYVSAVASGRGFHRNRMLVSRRRQRSRGRNGNL